ncbi:hypothetical protein [Fimbriimonas ginsengisoli]|uniref:Uncharacterized protein n=1 Tax=Fimbriimonas ginsengisoli Gsoil 348 TaxID=661478 RepID=A0A068NUF5_FIMGI|nr:hypothetical protein [Fimbriimonas ginsengisoli]AIE86410.1 hypothetical protein OP10G_3042 [Fimbriimonas ginsengisoli Gsoil 348]
MAANSAKQTTFMIFGAFATLIGLLLVFIPPMPQPLSPVSVGIASLGAILCVYWSLYRILPADRTPTVGEFQTNFLVALAGAELVTLSGVFIGSAPRGPLPFALVTWALMFGLVLPKMIAFWRRR